jgi:hypothetical protein
MARGGRAPELQAKAPAIRVYTFIFNDENKLELCYAPLIGHVELNYISLRGWYPDHYLLT